MAREPTFPNFRPIRLEDRDVLHNAFFSYQPETSELTFTTCFIWRTFYHFSWCWLGDTIVFLCKPLRGALHAMEPIGPAPRTEVVRTLLRWLREEKGVTSPSVERADSRLAAEVAQAPDLTVLPVREHFDYLYSTADLISLPGRKYHAKRTHIRKFLSGASYAYARLDRTLLAGCLNLADRWCRHRRCEEDMGLTEERGAVLEAIRHFEELHIEGGAILVRDRVEAFAMGELLNEQTAVIHVEKANPEMPGLYPLINQTFARECWKATQFINREEDLGDEGLRKAKMSYHPCRLVEKFRITLT